MLEIRDKSKIIDDDSMIDRDDMLYQIQSQHSISDALPIGEIHAELLPKLLYGSGVWLEGMRTGRYHFLAR